MCTDACRYLHEVEALQEMLLRACSTTSDSKMLSARASRKGDLVTQALTSLAATAQRPETVWENLQSAKARSHAQWAELCMRTMHAAVVCNAKVPYTEWCQTLVTTITSAAEIPRLQFRKLGVENQMELVADVTLTEDEVAEVRSCLLNANTS
jgi:precorrin-6x reductase